MSHGLSRLVQLNTLLAALLRRLLLLLLPVPAAAVATRWHEASRPLPSLGALATASQCCRHGRPIPSRCGHRRCGSSLVSSTGAEGYLLDLFQVDRAASPTARRVRCGKAQYEKDATDDSANDANSNCPSLSILRIVTLIIGGTGGLIDITSGSLPV